MKLKKLHHCDDAKNCSAACCCEKHLRSRSIVYCCKKRVLWKQSEKVVVDAPNVIDDCKCELERRKFENESEENMDYQNSDHNFQDWTFDSEPAVLQYFDIPESSLAFLSSLGPPPKVECPVLPKYQRKGLDLHVNNLL